MNPFLHINKGRLGISSLLTVGHISVHETRQPNKLLQTYLTLGATTLNAKSLLSKPHLSIQCDPTISSFYYAPTSLVHILMHVLCISLYKLEMQMILL